MPPPRQVGTATGSPGAGTALGGTGVALPCQGQRPVSGGGSGTAGDVGPCPRCGAGSAMGLGLAFPVQLWGGDVPSVGLSLSGAGGSALHRAAPPQGAKQRAPHPRCRAGQGSAPQHPAPSPSPLSPPGHRGTRCRAGAARPPRGCVSLAPWGSGSPRGCFPSSPPPPPSSPGASWRGG